MPSPYVPYTMAQVDEALTAIGGPTAVRPDDGGWSRPLAVISAAAAAWVEERAEDNHSAILRSAFRDLNSDCCFKPHDGVWPER